RRVLQDLALAARQLRLRKLLHEGSEKVRFLGVHGYELAARSQHRVGLAGDVAVVEAYDPELELARRFLHRRCRLLTLVDAKPSSCALRRERFSADRGNRRGCSG